MDAQTHGGYTPQIIDGFGVYAKVSNGKRFFVAEKNNLLGYGETPRKAIENAKNPDEPPICFDQLLAIADYQEGTLLGER